MKDLLKAAASAGRALASLTPSQKVAVFAVIATILDCIQSSTVDGHLDIVKFKTAVIVAAIAYCRGLSNLNSGKASATSQVAQTTNAQTADATSVLAENPLIGGIPVLSAESVAPLTPSGQSETTPGN